jgi:D-sedoheptulose 7-phosphate isomerase
MLLPSAEPPDTLDLDTSGSAHALGVGYLGRLQAALDALDLACLERMTTILERCYATGQTLFVIGNGGSAATASHLAADFTKLSTPPGSTRRFRALCFNDSSAALTAASNDLGYDEVFIEQLRAFLQPGDVVLGISTSGQSRNVVRALDYAAGRGASVLAITGRHGTGLRALAHEALVIESGSVQRVEDVTLVAGHMICLMVRARCEASQAVPPSTD